MRWANGSSTTSLRTATPTVAEPIRGRLIAIDGAHGPDVAKAATMLYQALIDRDATSGISRWDASGLFHDVVSAPAHRRDLSPRTLVLLYAADLAFRVRWEIMPALHQSAIVVAAPYVTTAITFGLATGLSSDWLRTLFRFAPVPARTIVLREGKATRTWKRKPERGFGECCTALLEETPEGFARRKTRTAMVIALSSAAEKHGGQVRDRDVRRLAREILTPRGRPEGRTPNPRR
jgi:thymidylate kinase